MPGGSLEDYKENPFSTLENSQILCQLLSALEYLHGRTPPIGHRDIKPANILVQYRRANEIRVKFADFGLAKAAEYHKTVCGTKYWAAPEIYSGFERGDYEISDKYSVAVDIYSCGVVIASQECGMPSFEDHERDRKSAGTKNWIEVVLAHIREQVKNTGSWARRQLLMFLLDTMLVVEPEGRMKAPECHQRALNLLCRISSPPCSTTGCNGAATVWTPPP